MAFDKCKFSTLFSKIAAKIPPVVTRALIFVYERQFAWTRWGTTKSEQFKITNGTHQGLVLSPSLFTVYVQELLDRLQASGMGCHEGHTFLGAVEWADDFLLTAPSRSSMQSMLDVASSFAREVGLQFFADLDPAKLKSKGIYMVGRQTGLEGLHCLGQQGRVDGGEKREGHRRIGGRQRGGWVAILVRGRSLLGGSLH